MPNLTERLLALYGEKKEVTESSSWIPKRKYAKDDFVGKAREAVVSQVEISENRASGILDEGVLLNDCRDDIFVCVATYLLEEYGEKGFEDRQEHFQESWERMYEKYDKDLIFALAELTDEMDETPFVNFAGYIDKDVVKEAVASIRKRAKSKRL